MSRTYKMSDPDAIYFLSFATVGWIDVFTRRIYKDIIGDSLRYCQQEKGLRLFAWCLMSNHIHLIVASKEGYVLPDIIRDMKKHTSKKVLKSIMQNTLESRREWMLAMFAKAGKKNSNNKEYQFWRQDNKPIEVYSNSVIDQKLNYIHNNPVEAGIVDNPEDYLYSSARNYAELDSLLQIDRI
jgi:putative transposase